MDVTTDENGNIYVSDWGNHRIQKFSNGGDFLAEWGRRGSASGEFNSPEGLAVARDGTVYVTEYWNHRIQVFTVGYPSPDPISGLTLNGSFEASPALDEWTYGGELPLSRSTHRTHGSYALKLGEEVAQTEQGLHEAWAHQTLYVDPTWNRPTLTFKYNMFVNDIMDYSDFFVAIQDGVGINHLATVLRDGYQPCTPNLAPAPATDLGWRNVSYDLSAFKGQHIRLVFSNRNLWPNAWGIWTYLDDVRVLDAGPSFQLPSDAYEIFLPVIGEVICDPIPIGGSGPLSAQLRQLP